jgi:hypothetical protein
MLINHGDVAKFPIYLADIHHDKQSKHCVDNYEENC